MLETGVGVERRRRMKSMEVKGAQPTRTTTGCRVLIWLPADGSFLTHGPQRSSRSEARRFLAHPLLSAISGIPGVLDGPTHLMLLTTAQFWR